MIALSNPLSYSEQAAQFRAQSEPRFANGEASAGLALLRQAVVRYAAAMETYSSPDGNGAVAIANAPESLRLARAETCREFGNRLWEAGEYAEAASIYQEAVDSYAQEADPASEETVRFCARRVLDCLTALRDHPQERLSMLIGRYERQSLRLALDAGTEAAQGTCRVEIARIFARRARPQEAVSAYLDALALYERAEATEENLLAQAECHHRLGGLLARFLHDKVGAARHYQAAISLYAAHEPFVYGVQSSLALCQQALKEVGQGS